MSRYLRDIRVLARQFRDFISSSFGISDNEVQEDPHFFAFLDFCVERPRLHDARTGGCIQRPMARTLVSRIQALAAAESYTGLRVPVTERSLERARELQSLYAPRVQGARAITPDTLRRLVDAIDLTSPYGIRLKAGLLNIAKSWGRPSEILNRLFPDEVDAGHDKGIVFIVPRSKTNPGPHPERLAIAHESDPNYCAICAAREWRDWLGAAYRGAFFTTLTNSLVPTGRPLSAKGLWKQLKDLARRCGIDPKSVSPYSLRKGSATTAAITGASWSEIQTGLRQKSLRYASAYVDKDALFDMMRGTVV